MEIIYRTELLYAFYGRSEDSANGETLKSGSLLEFGSIEEGHASYAIDGQMRRVILSYVVGEEVAEIVYHQLPEFPDIKMHTNKR